VCNAPRSFLFFADSILLGVWLKELCGDQLVSTVFVEGVDSSHVDKIEHHADAVKENLAHSEEHAIETLSVHDQHLQCTFHFLGAGSSNIEETITYVRQNSLYDGIRQTRAAGYGAHELKDTFHVKLVPVDELAVVIRARYMAYKTRNL